MLDATGPSRPRNAGRYRPFASAECWTLPALRVRGMLDATGPSRPRNAGRYRPFASAECWTLSALRVRGMLDATGPSSTPRPAATRRRRSPVAEEPCDGDDGPDHHSDHSEPEPRSQTRFLISVAPPRT